MNGTKYWYESKIIRANVASSSILTIVGIIEILIGHGWVNPLLMLWLVLFKDILVVIWRTWFTKDQIKPVIKLPGVKKEIPLPRRK